MAWKKGCFLIGELWQLDEALECSLYSSEPCVNFCWGTVDGSTFSRLTNDAYEEVVHWHRNISLLSKSRIIIV